MMICEGKQSQESCAKKRQNLTIRLVSKIKDYMGIWEVAVLVNGKLYTYPISSEFAVRKVESLIRRRKPGRALRVLKLFLTDGFNEFKKEKQEVSE